MLNWQKNYKKYCAIGVFFFAISEGFSSVFAQDNTQMQEIEQQKIQVSEDPKNDLSGVRDDIAKIKPEFARLTEKRDLLEREKVNLSERLIIITEKIRVAEDRVEVLESDIKTSDMREQALTADLSSRKAETAKLLAAMGRLSLLPATPLGAVEDEEKTVHTALILRSLTSELKKRADNLVLDLKLLRTMREDLKNKRRELSEEQVSLDSDGERLRTLMETRQNYIQETNNDLSETRKKLSELSQKEKTIEGLINQIDLENKRKEQEEKEQQFAKVEEAKKAAQLFSNQKGKSQLNDKEPVIEIMDRPNNQNIKLLTEQKFITLKGKLARPVLGKIVHQYGMPDKTGKKRQGITIQSKSSSIVTAPANAKVIFADSFKGQGSIVILNPVGKYYIVLSGLGVINVSPGQNVAMGEPIGRMASGIGQRNLYVEFRKDRQITNPNDWLAQTTKVNVASLHE